MNFVNRKKKGCGLFAVMLLIAVLALCLAPVAKAQPALELKSMPLVTTVIGGATSIGFYTNITTGGAFTTTNAGGVTGIPIVQGFGSAVTWTASLTNGTSSTNGTFTAYFAPSVDGTNISLATNQWWQLFIPANGVGSQRVTNSVAGSTNFSSTMLQGYRFLHCVGFWNASSNTFTSMRVTGTVPK